MVYPVLQSWSPGKLSPQWFRMGAVLGKDVHAEREKKWKRDREAAIAARKLQLLRQGVPGGYFKARPAGEGMVGSVEDKMGMTFKDMLNPPKPPQYTKVKLPISPKGTLSDENRELFEEGRDMSFNELLQKGLITEDDGQGVRSYGVRRRLRETEPPGGIWGEVDGKGGRSPQSKKETINMGEMEVSGGGTWLPEGEEAAELPIDLQTSDLPPLETIQKPPPKPKTKKLSGLSRDEIAALANLEFGLPNRAMQRFDAHDRKILANRKLQVAQDTALLDFAKGIKATQGKSGAWAMKEALKLEVWKKKKAIEDAYKKENAAIDRQVKKEEQARARQAKKLEQYRQSALRKQENVQKENLRRGGKESERIVKSVEEFNNYIPQVQGMVRSIDDMIRKVEALPPEYRENWLALNISDLFDRDVLMSQENKELNDYAKRAGLLALKKFFSGATSEGELKASGNLFYSPRVTAAENLRNLKKIRSEIIEEVRGKRGRYLKGARKYGLTIQPIEVDAIFRKKKTVEDPRRPGPWRPGYMDK